MPYTPHREFGVVELTSRLGCSIRHPGGSSRSRMPAPDPDLYHHQCSQNLPLAIVDLEEDAEEGKTAGGIAEAGCRLQVVNRYYRP